MKFLAVLSLTYGPGEFSWANVDVTVTWDVPTLDNIREIEALVRTANRGVSGVVLTALIPLAGE